MSTQYFRSLGERLLISLRVKPVYRLAMYS